MGTKKNVAIISFLAVVSIIGLGVVEAQDILSCNYYSEHGGSIKYCESIIFILFSLAVLFPFSIITYFMHDEVFRAWWSLARWMVPTIAVATILIEFVPKNGGFFNMDALIYLLVLAPLYAVFIIGSLWKIVRTYRKLKHSQGK